MEMSPNESFRQYVQRWRDVAAQVQPPLLEKEIAPTFVRTLKEPFLNYMLGNATKNFEDLVISGELIEQDIREGKIRDPSGTLVEVEHQATSDAG
ncbi:hypothetical protein V6N11_029143 [Hibiscus sabdariffa]|uniref:Uncharacterized protein n=1 Tax=Hibiscus sabdariffa TaxID=183260 RepID=A0ABR2NRH8_9ROSI